MKGNERSSEPPDHLARALTIAATVTSAVPWLGGPIAEVISGLASNRKFERIRDVVQGLAEDLATFRSEVSEQYVRTEAFADLLEQTLRQVMQEGDAEKRRAFRNLLANAIREPGEDVAELLQVVRLLGELTPKQLQVLEALAVVPGQLLDSDSPLATLTGRLPNFDVAQLIGLVEDLNGLRLTRIDNWAVMTGRGSSDLRSYLTPLGLHVALLAAQGGGYDRSSPTDANRPMRAGLGVPLADEWRRLVGQRVCLEPLVGMPDERPDPWFEVEGVTEVDVKFLKRSNDQHVRLPLHALSPPWGAPSEGGIRASIEAGRLVFDSGTERWRWLAL